MVYPTGPAAWEPALRAAATSAAVIRLPSRKIRVPYTGSLTWSIEPYQPGLVRWAKMPPSPFPSGLLERGLAPSVDSFCAVETAIWKARSVSAADQPCSLPTCRVVV